MITPALLEAADVLRGSELKLYTKLHGKLSPGEYRPLKLWPIAREMKMNRASAGRALKELVRLGFLREGPRQPDGVRCYLLITARGEAIKNGST